MVFRLLLKLFPTPGNIIALATFIIGMIYPTYNSFLAIESPNDADDKQWLTYWVVVCTLQLLEKPLYVVLGWFPFYSLFKLIFVMWLSHPQTKGATVVYDLVARPVIIIAANKAKEMPAFKAVAEKFLASELGTAQADQPKSRGITNPFGKSKPTGAAAAAAPFAATAPPAPIPEPVPAATTTVTTPLAADAPPFLPPGIVENSLAPKPHAQ